MAVASSQCLFLQWGHDSEVVEWVLAGSTRRGTVEKAKIETPSSPASIRPTRIESCLTRPSHNGMDGRTLRIGRSPRRCPSLSQLLDSEPLLPVSFAYRQIERLEPALVVGPHSS